LRQWLTVKITGASTYYLQPSGTGYIWSTINSSFVNTTSDGLHNVPGGTSLINGRNAPFFLGNVIQSDEIPIDGVLSVSMRIEVLNSSFGTHSNVTIQGLMLGMGTLIIRGVHYLGPLIGIVQIKLLMMGLTMWLLILHW
jgi:hypothetical protein